MMVVGVIAVQQELKLKSEHKYTIGSKPQQIGIEKLFQMVDPDFGKISPAFEEISLILFPETEENITNETIGQALGGIITSHRRWRV